MHFETIIQSFFHDVLLQFDTIFKATKITKEFLPLRHFLTQPDNFELPNLGEYSCDVQDKPYHGPLELPYPITNPCQLIN